MENQDSWHSQDAFWELFEPILFNQQRQSTAQEEVDKIVTLLQIEAQPRILDLCCGIGRHSLEFSRLGFDVTGVDRTAVYIKKAKLEARKLDLDATFLVGDMREFYEPGSFDIILNMFGSFGYFENPGDDKKVVENMYASLRVGGKFMIETNGKEILARDFQKRVWNQEGDTLVLSEKVLNQDWSRIETRWIVIEGTNRIEHKVSVHLYDAAELSSLLSDCGFSGIRVYGNLDGTAYDQTAHRLVVVGRKD